MRVVVTGGTGYVGCHLIDALARRSVEVLAPARATTPPEAKEFLRSRGAEVREVDFDRPSDLAELFRGRPVWFHLVGSVARLRGDSFEHRHRVITARLVEQAKRAGVERVVFLSALGSGPDARNAYHRTKWEAEQEIVRSGIAGAIVRPSLICGRVVGPRDSKLVRRYIEMIRKRGRALVLGAGRNRIQPVDVRDLVECMVRAAERREDGVAAFDLGGPDQVTFDEFIGRLARALGREAKIVHIPMWIAAAAARILEPIQAAPAITRETVALMRSDNICARDSIERSFGFRPRDLDETLGTYAGESAR